MNAFRPQQAALPIDFLIVGAGIAGLSCAIALRRVGHRVLVVERERSIDTKDSGGVRMAPNLAKILYHWGLKDDLLSISVKSQAIDLHLFETGERLGTHIWDEEMLRETRGEFLVTHYEDLRMLLYKAAVSHGATIRFNSLVTSIDPDTPAAKLASGETLRADVIVGADGVHGLSRKLVMSEDEAEEEVEEARVNLYSMTIPQEAMQRDPDLKTLLNQKFVSMITWFGHQHCALGFPLGGRKDFGLILYVPRDGKERDWYTPVSKSALLKLAEPCEIRVQKLLQLATGIVCVPVDNHIELENWVHDSGRLLAIGDAAHPITPAGIQQSAMALEDGAVLAKLFSHLRTRDQITNFLYAFQDLRQPRCAGAVKKEATDVAFMALPRGEIFEGRNQAMRAKRDAGLDIFDAGAGEDETPQWVEIKEIFGYDAEDEADNWWVEWGLLRERAKGTELSMNFLNNVKVEHEDPPPASELPKLVSPASNMH